MNAIQFNKTKFLLYEQDEKLFQLFGRVGILKGTEKIVTNPCKYIIYRGLWALGSPRNAVMYKLNRKFTKLWNKLGLPCAALQQYCSVKVNFQFQFFTCAVAVSGTFRTSVPQTRACVCGCDKHLLPAASPRDLLCSAVPAAHRHAPAHAARNAVHYFKSVHGARCVVVNTA